MQELFDMPKKTIKALMELAKDTHVEVLEPEVIHGGDTKRFKDAPSIYFMEQNLFRRSYKKKVGEVQEISIFSLRNPKEELIWTARKINELVRQKHYRYRDIAVVTGDVETYSNYVETIYKKYDIPYFLDMTKEVLFHQFIEFIRSILEVVSNDFSYHSVMRLLRTGYCGVTMDEVDRLENYLLATGIRGKKMWSNRWLRLPRNEKAYDLESLENLRQKLMEGLLPVVQVFEDTQATVEQQIKALYVYIVSLQVEQQLFYREEELLKADEQAKSKEYGQIYAIVMDLFEKCIHILGQEVLTIQELEEILDSGFEAARVAVIPPGYDSVTIGDIERSRLNHVKVLIFIGVNEGIVPKNVNQGGIISQYERDNLEKEISLAPGAREQAFIQKFYLYLNMTKPSDKLYLSYSRMDSEGKTLRPSYLIRTILQMFPDMKVQEVCDIEAKLNTSTTASAKEYFIKGEKDAAWYALAKCFLESEDREIREGAKTILDAFYYRYRHDPISQVVAEALYGKQIEGSVTRLEQYAKCAYAHFLSYGLYLQQREESGFESVDMGNLYHTAIERYSKKLADSSYTWFTVPEEVRDMYAQSAMEEAILSYPNLSIYATAENEHMAKRMNHIFKQTVWALTTQVRKGCFVPNNFEISFSKADHLQALEFELENNNRIELRGRIDRLDICEDDNRLYVKVIDYKSGNTEFDLLQLYHGLQLQLVVYMNAAMELEKKKHPMKEVVPGGLFYYHIDDPVIEVGENFTEEDVRTEILRKLKPDGLVNEEEAIYRAMDAYFETKSDVIPVELKKSGEHSSRSSVVSTEEFAILSEYVNHNIMQKGNEIYSGNVEVSPFADAQKSGCDYCPYKSVCGFDIKIKGFESRRGKKIDKKEIFVIMETENAISREKQKN
jgi:ATP-dependent helicase/nuclease subunit B